MGKYWKSWTGNTKRIGKPGKDVNWLETQLLVGELVDRLVKIREAGQKVVDLTEKCALYGPADRLRDAVQGLNNLL